MSSSGDAFKFTKLNGQNYAVWAGHMENTLASKYLWMVVDGSEPRPESPVAKEGVPFTEAERAQLREVQDWIARDRAACGIIRNGCEISQWPHIQHCTTSKDIWDALQKFHRDNQMDIDVHYYFGELFTRKYVEGTLMADHIAALRDLQHRINSTGETIPDIYVARALALSLPKTPAWEVLKVQLLSTKPLTADGVSSMLQAEANRRIRDKSGGAMALFTSEKTRKGKGNQSRDPKPTDECRYCKHLGHWANKCPQREDDKRKAGNSQSSTGKSANTAVSQNQELTTRETGHVYVATDSRGRTGTILDTGATGHMFCERGQFESYQLSHGDTVSVGDRRDIPVEGRGSVALQLASADGPRKVVLHNVLHIPRLGMNLVSLGSLQSAGATYRSVRAGISVMMNGEGLFTARLDSGLYHLDAEPSTSGAAYAAASGSLRLWHRRLGHLHHDAVRKLARDGLVHGLTLSGPNDFDHVCEGCALGKSHRLPFPKVSETKYEKMELLAVDLTGPMSIATWSGMQYALIVVEASSRYIICRLLERKTDAAAAMKEIIALLERQSGLKVKKIRTDNGTEFVNSVVDDLCKRNGIVHETTTPYTPEQNGIAERAIATCLEMVRCMLHSSKMDLRYWGEALMYAVHIRNLSPTSSIPDAVPHEAWTGRKPSLSHLRVFGSTAYANIPKKVRGGKLEATAVKCRMLGWWADETKGYRLEDVDTRELITSRDVRFVEDESPSDLVVVEDPDNGRTVPTGVTPAIATHADDEQVAVTEAVADGGDCELADDPKDQEDVPTVLESMGEEDQGPPAVRDRPSRVRKAPARFGVAATEDEVEAAINQSSPSARHALVVTTGDPLTYREAMKTAHAKQWEKAVEAELEQLRSSGTFEWVPSVPDGRKPIGSRIVFQTKRDGDGNVVKYKARIVAKGYSQIPGQDFEHTFSSVARLTTLRTLLALSARENWELHQVDVVGAYLQGDLGEELYVEPPDGIRTKNDDQRLWRLRRPLYGLKQAGRQWKLKLDGVMKKLGFATSSADECLYTKRKDGKVEVIVLVYVDDMAVAAPLIQGVMWFKTELGKVFPITDLGELKHILGVRVRRDRVARTIRLDQTAYLQALLTRHGMENSTPVATPAVVKDRLTTAHSPSNAEEQKSYDVFSGGFRYLECLGGILYATHTRPDIQYATGVCAQFGANPGKPHLIALKRILRYLKGTIAYGLVLGGKNDGADIVGWTDSDWAQDLDDRRSIAGFVFDVAGGTVSWSSKKQPTVALSTVEAEYMASANATKEAIWLRTLLSDLGSPQTTSTIIRADNQGCISLSHHPIAHSRAKHIDIRHHFVRERVASSEIELQFCPTHRMLADILTKSLPRDAFEKFRKALGVLEE